MSDSLKFLFARLKKPALTREVAHFSPYKIKSATISRRVDGPFGPD